jgi:hypothetical protein
MYRRSNCFDSPRSHAAPMVIGSMMPLVLAVCFGLVGCGYHLGPPVPSEPLACCHTSGHG